MLDHVNVPAAGQYLEQFEVDFQAAPSGVALIALAPAHILALPQELLELILFGESAQGGLGHLVAGVLPCHTERWHLPAHLVAGHRAGGSPASLSSSRPPIWISKRTSLPGAGLPAVHLEQPGLGHVEDDLERRPGRPGGRSLSTPSPMWVLCSSSSEATEPACSQTSSLTSR